MIGGGQVGYNYQFSPNGVLGLEADIQGSGERGSGQFADPFATSVCGFTLLGACVPFPLNGMALSNYQAKIDWFGTLRGWLGLLVGNHLLIYGTGGLAYGKVAVSGNTNISAEGVGVFTPTTAGFGRDPPRLFPVYAKSHKLISCKETRYGRAHLERNYDWI